ncbi:rhodanese-like domain-containing protein [Aeromicrobium sp. A1-2]|uniref:rhodanese-like domain-containing protein n=1 Tax=Aeromicrobium sp. A1-2 TaxID=2107713 RepID=UPI000E46B91B|nr:rhodanese-like domain-containing protein [Aeromicrobium sp. A1-2]AXT85043.1 rhodanese-like domain-containing protein [Aeromicrobium sp. A1-2]
MTSIHDVSIARAAELAAEGALMLDVREPDEWQAGHMAGAVHVPLGQLDPSTIPVGTPIVAVCRSGNRSGKAAILLADAGHEVVNMDGGMLAWSEAGLPVVTTEQDPGAM